jgi:hypothetical protein
MIGSQGFPFHSSQRLLTEMQSPAGFVPPI